jgi:pimeloyl-ACP methyl ester carboxylesterase
MADEPTVVLVHGAWHGAWAWDELRKRLDDEGIATVAVDLPSIGPDPDVLTDMYADAATAREAIDAVDGPVVVVGHSYGGVVITEAAAGAANVTHLVYLTAFQLDDGESLLGLLGGQEPEWFTTPDGGRTIVPANPEHVFYNDCPPEVAAAAAARIQRMNRECFVQPIHQAAWHDIPSTYVVCERDNAIPVFAQDNLAQRAGSVRRLDADHSPFLSMPDEVVAILRDVVGEAKATLA